MFNCENNKGSKTFEPISWEERNAVIPTDSTTIHGETYLSVYSEIYSLTDLRTHALTATVSLRNVSQTETIVIEGANYYNTNGDLTREYVKTPIYIKPMETLEIVIAENDIEGGTGGNFMFDWYTPKNCPEPLFEAIMISTTGQQGISFTSVGHRIK
ncbi:MAG: hypothetical protein BM564_00220 [Bacteroidetes bacterium MedPE-SWsnd-G2]|nr:MAG: hypothetical protein BM564_00220 [Bacteroidetes bacterium MedPE-SWsnd-G2]